MLAGWVKGFGGLVSAVLLLLVTSKAPFKIILIILFLVPEAIAHMEVRGQILEVSSLLPPWALEIKLSLVQRDLYH